jgi:DNA polymerase III delta prime subunit
VYRPYSPHELCGQDEVKRLLIDGLKKRSLSHTYVFHGPSGTGKTTCTRIIGMGMMCQNGLSLVGCGQCRECKAIMTLNSNDYEEINSANLTGVDHIRDLRSKFYHAPFLADYKILVFDECHKLTEAAQNMLLKEVEDVSDHLYFVFCSTDPTRILETLRNRCINIEFKLVDEAQIKTMLLEICDWEGIPADRIDLEGIVQKAAGRPRNALFELQKAVAIGNVPTKGGGKMFAIRNLAGGGRAMVVSMWPSFDAKAFGDALNNPAFLTGCELLAEKTYPFEELLIPATMALWPDGEKLRFNGSFKTQPDGLVDTIKANKARIMTLLQNGGPGPGLRPTNAKSEQWPD